MALVESNIVSKNKRRSDNNELRKEFEDLIKENKTLKKELGSAYKRLSRYEAIRDDLESYSEDVAGVKANKTFQEKVGCKECTKGKLTSTSIGAMRYIVVCDLCGWRKIEKING